MLGRMAHSQPAAVPQSFPGLLLLVRDKGLVIAASGSSPISQGRSAWVDLLASHLPTSTRGSINNIYRPLRHSNANKSQSYPRRSRPSAASVLTGLSASFGLDALICAGTNHSVVLYLFLPAPTLNGRLIPGLLVQDPHPRNGYMYLDSANATEIVVQYLLPSYTTTRSAAPNLIAVPEEIRPKRDGDSMLTLPRNREPLCQTSITGSMANIVALNGRLLAATRELRNHYEPVD
jgi:hypothetical protein